MMTHQDATKIAYDNSVKIYAALFDNKLENQLFTRNALGAFVELVKDTGNMQVADIGCGPGHITAILNERGLHAFGLDLSSAMISHAQQAHPRLHFAEARMEALPVEDNALGGLLTHYSTIHTPPKELLALLTEQVRVLAAGGLLMVSFFATSKGTKPIQFDHKVAPAYSWPVAVFAEMLEKAGLKVIARIIHDPESERGFLDAHLIARKS